MSWTKLGAEFPDEARDLSDAAFRVHVEALCWSNRRLLDLVIPKRDLRRFAEAADPEAAANEAVSAGWWEDRGESWFIGLRWPEWQRDRVQVERQRERNAEEQRRHRRHKLGDHSLCLPSAKCRLSAGQSAPDPERNGTEQNRTGFDVEPVVKKDAEGFWLSSPPPTDTPSSRPGRSGSSCRHCGKVPDHSLAEGICRPCRNGGVSDAEFVAAAWAGVERKG